MYKVGITGNYYFTSNSKEELIDICNQIDKSISSIYWNNKYKVFVIRIKSKYHKNLCKKLL